MLFVFSHEPDGSVPWKPGYVSLKFRRLRHSVGLDRVRLHDLRHFVATTTGLWYHRLCRALRDQTVTGAMSESLGNVDVHIASAVVRSVIELPPSIGLTSLRSLGWRMADLVASGVRLNLLSLEALCRRRAPRGGDLPS